MTRADAVGIPKDGPTTLKKCYRVGTLTYTTTGLIALFAWMLWGDFCFTLMETVIQLLPLKLGSLGARNVSISLVMTTLPGILNSTVCPWVSFKSDRYRSRWGRRIPFILWTAPFLTLFLILLGYSEPIGRWVYPRLFHDGSTVSSAAVCIFLMGVFMVGFQFFNMFVGSVYWYLFNDVVPEQFMGRFLGLFRVVGGLAGALYNWLLVPRGETHLKEIFLGAALLYFVGFGLMCLRVREGDYPPPPENLGGRPGLWAGVKTFLVECFSLRYYWYLFGTHTFYSMAACVVAFNLLFKKDIGLDMTQIGRIGMYVGLASMALMYPAGMVSDRFHPLRVLTAALAAMVVLGPIQLVYLFRNFDSNTAYYINLAISLGLLPFTLLYSASEMPMYMRLMPKERFGQFCSAQAMIRSLGMIIGSLLAGVMFDLVKGFHPDPNFCYRYSPLWTWAFQIAALVCLLLLYREWKRRGGATDYVPPQVSQG